MARKSQSVAGPPAAEAPLTQRAYTLRLRGIDPQDHSWRDALWATHEAVNKGAKVFGEWLLTLRGGLSHELAEPPPLPEGKSRSAEETAALRKNRRILLALSWLSVEDERGAPPPASGLIVAHGDKCSHAQDNQDSRNRKVLDALRDILCKRGLAPSDIGSWIHDCEGSLKVRIRDDAVWVNRSQCFDCAVRRVGSTLTRDEVWDILKPFFGSREVYFADVELTEEDSSAKEKAKDLVQKAGQWLSSRFGTGAGASFESMSKVYAAMAKWADAAPPFPSGTDALKSLAQSLDQFRPETNDAGGILRLISGPGYKSATRNIVKGWEQHTSAVSRDDLKKFAETAADDEQKSKANVGGKGRRPWSNKILEQVERACGFTYLQTNGPARHKQFAVMLDHAARRVSIGHSWIKRAEAERRRFEADAQRLGTVPADAAAWLDAYVQERSGSAGGEYRIRRRAVEGWDEILKRWNRPTCASAEDRVAAAREVQADPEIDKFGDIQLFEALASDDALCVWRNGNDVAPDRLKDYVFAHDARFKQRRFKVPAYRHPDALRHPVFCDFGNSRWKVEYSALEAAKAARGGRRIGAQDEEWIKNPRGIRMGLWNGDAVNDFNLQWSCKRLSADLALRQPAHNGQVRSVSRADRLGCAASGIKPGESPSPAGLFSQADWNARLQAPRSQLNDLAAYLDLHGGGWDDRARKMRDRIAWLVTFSAKLECRGPFIDYAARHEIAPNRKGEYYPNADRNRADKREGHAKLMLSRLPGLRVLSVDLGHRFAAACAVWETLSRAELKREISGCSVIDGGAGATDLYLHTRHTDRAGKERKTVYRRIGSDKLPDGSDHPAPWARLDRQFLIKLQGEEAPARKASPDEIETIRQMESQLGYVREAHKPLPTQIDELLSEAVRLVRLGLRRHGDAARIAYAFHPESARLTPGGGVEVHTPDTRQQAILDALIRWHGMAMSDRWSDPRAMDAWQARIQPVLTTELPALTPDADRWERKRFRTALEAALTPVATALSRDSAGTLHTLWSERWEADDAAWRPRLRQLRRMLLPRGLRPVDADTDAEAAARKARRGAARHTGGLSLTRSATIRELYQAQKAYAMRPEPDNPRRNIPESNDDGFAEFGRSILEAVERLREQRVKQLASRIAEAALGVGRAPRTGDHDGKRPLAPVDAACHAIVIESLRNYRPDELQTRRENRALMNWSAGKVRKYLEEACQLHGLHLREVMPNYTSRQCSRTGLPGLRCDDVPIDEFLTAPWWNKAVNAAAKRLQENGTDSLDRLLVALREKWSSTSEQDKLRQRTLRLPRAGGDLFVAAPPSGDATRGRHRGALQADLNAAANIGLRALLDPDFPGKWWYVPATMNNEGWRVPAPKSCAGAACLNAWKVAHKDGYLSADGAPLAVADDDSVRNAEDAVKAAKKELDAAKKTAKTRGADQAALDAAKKRHDEATAALKEAKKAASQKEIINIWQNPRAEWPASAEGRWHETPAYWRWVRKRVVASLWEANGLGAPPADLVRDGQA